MELNILMVEDDSSVAEMMELFFKKEQWNVDIARDGVEAVDKFKERPDYYDMITLDLNLPKKMGFKSLKKFALSLKVFQSSCLQPGIVNQIKF